MEAVVNWMPCQVCGRKLTTTRDGLVKPHKVGSVERVNCRGVGYRHERWRVGQRLQHHSSGIWEVVEDRAASTPHRDYLIRCVKANPVLAADEQDREMVVHGEYMHRHGWTPVGDDCTCGCDFAAHDHRHSDNGPCGFCDDWECCGYEPDFGRALA
jgi:hypothetical protein